MILSRFAFDDKTFSKKALPQMKATTLLCVDDDPQFRNFYSLMFGSYGYEVITSGNGRQALKLFHCREHDIAAVISDYEMPGMNGAELPAELKRCNPLLPIIIVSGSQPVLEEALHFVDASVEKGSPIGTFLDKVESLLSRRPAMTDA